MVKFVIYTVLAASLIFFGSGLYYIATGDFGLGLIRSSLSAIVFGVALLLFPEDGNSDDDVEEHPIHTRDD